MSINTELAAFSRKAVSGHGRVRTVLEPEDDGYRVATKWRSAFGPMVRVVGRYEAKPEAAEAWEDEREKQKDLPNCQDLRIHRRPNVPA